MSSTSYRLPRQVIPLAYDVVLDATPKRTAFSGTLAMSARVLEPTDRFELNAADLKVKDVVALVGKKRVVGKAKLHADRQSVELVFAEALKKGKLTITLAFAGKLNPSMHGLYLAKDGADTAIVSQCEAPDARRIFPCFDEPDLKATLGWTVVTDPGLTVITNGALVASRKKGNKVVHTFKRTKVIPTYLAAVTIGTYEATKVKRLGGVPCRIVCGPGKLGQTDFALGITCFALPFFQDYFGQKYDYGKLDQVAVPGFDAGAMENVGAIFYRANLLLMQPGMTSWAGQKRIAEVVAHELSHQWFGNLVTMKWWDDLWLNEAFATWIAFKCADLWQPEWRLWDEYLESKEGALEADGLESTHPVYSEVKSPAEATELFDIITYEKGCAVLRMCESYLGEEVFKDGIRRYQAAFRRSNARGGDLWQKLEEASGEPVRQLMQSWVTQGGFPLVTVSESVVDGKSVLHFSQRRFFSSPDEMQKEHEQAWTVPLVIRYATGNGVKTHRVLMRERELSVTLPGDGPAAWVYPNHLATGFYRLRLSDELLDKLLTHGLASLEPASRTSLVNDAWALVRAGLFDIERFMDVLSAFTGERDYVVVRNLCGRIAYLEQRVVEESARADLRAFARELLGGVLDELGFEREPEEPEARGVLRAAVINLLGDTARDAAVLDEAERRVALEMQNPAAIDPNLAGIAVALGALRGDVHKLESYVRTFQARKKARLAPDLVSRYLGALGYFEDPKAAAKVRALCLDGTVPQDQLRLVLAPMLARRAAQRETWAFVKKNWETLAPRIGLMGIARFVETMGALPVELHDDVAKFFKKHPVAEAARALKKALEAMQLRKGLVEREAARLTDWLARWGETGG